MKLAKMIDSNAPCTAASKAAAERVYKKEQQK